MDNKDNKVSKKNLALNILGLIASVGFTVFWGLAWINNCYKSYFFHLAPAESKKEAFTGFISWLEWSAMDYATIFTLIPLLGGIAICWGFIRIFISDKRPGEYFPFSNLFNNIVIYLGLIGTIWGLIMIGYYDPKTINIEDLIKCLHTALFSTLMALIWIFVISLPLVIPLMKRWHCAYYGLQAEIDADETPDISEAVGKLSAAVDSSAESLKVSGQKINDFNQGLTDTSDKLKLLTESLATVKKDNIDGVFAEVKNAATKLAQAGEAISNSITTIYQTAKLQADFAQLQTLAFKSVLEQWQKEADLRQNKDSALSEREAELSAVSGQLKEAQERIEELKKAGLTANEELVRSQAKLTKVLGKANVGNS